VNALVEFE
jgi:hypothetical protein